MMLKLILRYFVFALMIGIDGYFGYLLITKSPDISGEQAALLGTVFGALTTAITTTVKDLYNPKDSNGA